MKRKFGMAAFLCFLSLFPCFAKAKYVGKTKVALEKKFKQLGEPLNVDGKDYDEALYFSNEKVTVTMEKTTVTKFKNSSQNIVLAVQYVEYEDGCQRLNTGNYDKFHYDYRNRIAGDYTIVHNRFDSARNEIVKFNREANRLNAASYNEMQRLLKSTPVGSSFYLYRVLRSVSNEGGRIGHRTNSEQFGNAPNIPPETVTVKTFQLIRVDVFEDSRTNTQRKVAYIYDKQSNQYFNEKKKSIDKDYAKSIVQDYKNTGWIETSKTKGNSVAIFLKDGVIVRSEIGDKSVVESAERGDSKSMQNLAESYFKDKNYGKAREWIQKAADKGYGWGFTNLGNLYWIGKGGLKKDPAKAMECYKKATDLGDSDGLVNIGLCYFYGMGVPKDIRKAKEYWQKAADLGNATAINNLKSL